MQIAPVMHAFYVCVGVVCVCLCCAVSCLCARILSCHAVSCVLCTVCGHGQYVSSGRARVTRCVRLTLVTLTLHATSTRNHNAGAHRQRVLAAVAPRGRGGPALRVPQGMMGGGGEGREGVEGGEI